MKKLKNFNINRYDWLLDTPYNNIEICYSKGYGEIVFLLISNDLDSEFEIGFDCFYKRITM